MWGKRGGSGTAPLRQSPEGVGRAVPSIPPTPCRKRIAGGQREKIAGMKMMEIAEAMKRQG
ncbi:MAG: hypothetical protein R6U32_03800 [Candidatus Woesearchaeota archaeon]